MPKTFYTEKDIEDLFHSGVKSLEVGDEVVLTELAYEKAQRLGFQLILDGADNPPAAPVRPYLSAPHTRQAPGAKPIIAPAAQTESQPKPALTPTLRGAPQGEGETDIETRIRSAVIARLGDQVDAKLLNNIIQRVVKATGLK